MLSKMIFGKFYRSSIEAAPSLTWVHLVDS